MNSDSGYGYLKVRVTAAGGTIPVEGAAVLISDYNGVNSEDDRLLANLRTNAGGLTETVTLPAPAKLESMTPGAAQPYALYNITVQADGYYPVEGAGVPVFDGVTSVQPFDLLPLTEPFEEDGAEWENGRRVMIFETPEPESLRPGNVTREDIGNQNGRVTGGRVSSPDSRRNTDLRPGPQAQRWQRGGGDE